MRPLSGRPSLAVVAGASSLVLIAPHAGRRDPRRRPWGREPLKMNDLHTGSLTRELAARLDASAIVNEDGDRNDVDLGRISAAHDGAPHFLEAVGAAVEAAVARHGRATVLTVHGWNVGQPAVDLGLGAPPAEAPFSFARDIAASPAFVAATLRPLVAALARRDIAATPGLRYPARARENLLQLFTGRHRDDDRPLVRRLGAVHDRVDAVQLELSLPLRLPGVWRTRFVDACVDAFARVAAPAPVPAPWPVGSAPATDRHGLEFVADGLCGLAAIDDAGGRLLLFPDDGTLVVFTGERVGTHAPGRVAGLTLARADDGALALAYEGPMLRFPDTTPFEDLERGLAVAALVDARVRLELVPSHRDETGAPCPFGAVRGAVVVDGARHDVAGDGVRSWRERVLSPQPRAALRLGRDTSVLAVAGAAGTLCNGRRHASLADATVVLAPGPPAALRLRARGPGGELALDAALGHRLPVVRGGASPGRILLAVCRLDGRAAGWAELPGA